MTVPVLTLEVRQEPDVVLARQRARQIAGLLGFPHLDQTRIATATSELARNAFIFAGGGRAEFLVERNAPQSLIVRVRERGSAGEGRPALLEGEHAAPGGPGPGLGLLGARRLMDRFEVAAAPGGGVVITMAKLLPRRPAPLSTQDLARVSAELARHAPQGLLDELQQQNQELMRALQELRERQSEVMDLHRRELEETNRGVVALYAELDENAKALKRISDLKSRFLSNMSHEFRSPLNTILTLSGFLLDRSDGELTAEQEKQVGFIRKAADDLSALVNDLLDLAKVEAGKAAVRPKSFAVAELFDGLRGTIRPLLVQSAVALRFEEPVGLATLQTDEGKLAQILRNFLSNAVKFTERGEIRVAAAAGPGDTVIFSVSDTGIGIAPADRARVFEEFGQVEGPLQGRVKGTGLGLPLSRKLAELLGGNVSVKSEPGVGSTFFAVVPRVFREPGESAAAAPGDPWEPDPARLPVLVVENDPVDMILYEKILDGSEFQVLPARTLEEARRALRRVRPAAVLLDVMLDVESGWTLLSELKGDAATRDVSVLVLTVVDGREQAMALGADDFRPKPVDQGWLLGRLRLLAPRPALTALLIDDAESDRRVLRDFLSRGGRYRVIEATRGGEGLSRARAERPGVIFLDLVMPDMSGAEVLGRLKGDPETAGIPVIINTSKIVDDDERGRLSAGAAAILQKGAGPGPEAFDRIREALVRAGLGHVSAAPEV